MAGCWFNEVAALCTKLLADYAGPVVKRETAYPVKPIHDTHFAAHIRTLVNEVV